MRSGLLISIFLFLGVLIGAVLREAVEVTSTEPNPAIRQPLSPSTIGTASLLGDTRVAGLTIDPEVYENLVVRLDNADFAYQQQEQQISELQTRVHSLEAKMVENHSGDMVERSAGSVRTARDKTPDQVGEASLIAAGIDSQTAGWIQQRLDEIEMEKLYLKNTALREGWVKKSRYRKSLRELNGRFDALREDVGDDNFDRLLYAVGRHNRVLVRSTMNSSPAQQYGLDSGDTIVSYDGKRIFSAAELQRITSQGDTTASISIEVTRNGSPMNLYVPGGPLGIRLTTRRVKP